MQKSQSTLRPADAPWGLGSADPHELSKKIGVQATSGCLPAVKNRLALHKLGEMESQGVTRVE